MGGRFEWFLLCAIALVFALLLFGWFLAPPVIPFAPVIALVAYATIVRLGVPVMRRSDPRTLTIAAWCGTVAAVIFVPSILIEYAGRTVDNALMYGAVFFVWFLAGVLAARLTGRVTDAVLTTTVSAMISSLVFITTLLASYYLMRGSALQETFFRTEGDYDDFARGGGTDFDSWIIGDMFGGTFFHLRLGAIIAAGLGGVAGALMRSSLRFKAARNGRASS